MDSKLTTSKLLAPEDLEAGDYITVTHMTYELICMPCDQPWQTTIDPKRVTVMHYDAGKPLKVVSVCVPFALVKDVKGDLTPLDLRRCRIARLSEEYGKKMFKA